MGIAEVITGVDSAILSPISAIFTKREERKQAHNAAVAALAQAQEQRKTAQTEGEIKIELGDQQLETLLAGQLSTTWKDEYITLSIVGIINAVMVGGVLQGFGFPAFLDGVTVGVKTLGELFDLRFIMTAVVMSGIGLSVWRKV